MAEGLNHAKSSILLSRLTCFSTSLCPTLHYHLFTDKGVISPFFPCTDITMFWTFLYRSSDCFSSSILRSWKRKRRVKNHSGANLRVELNHLIWHKVNHNLSNVPSLHWLPSMIQLPFSFAALPHLVRKENDYRQRTVVLTVSSLKRVQRGEQWAWTHMVPVEDLTHSDHTGRNITAHDSSYFTATFFVSFIVLQFDTSYPCVSRGFHLQNIFTF